MIKKCTIIFILISQLGVAQEIKIDSCGISDSAELNKFEVQYFNQVLGEQRKRQDFDFNGKKVGFAHGNFGKQNITKNEYFDRWGREYFKNGSNVSNQMFILTDKEKEESEGHDVIIVSWSKVPVVGKHKKRLIRRTKPVSFHGQ